ncbi:MAG: alpha/beta fold hydrolase [Deltaproteobacteria bacterium]|nr:MAG: alpha/beta fold hydrolase [Deltaproteobacteria bacterium]
MQKQKVSLTNPLDWATGRFSASTSGSWGIIERTPTEEEKQKFLNYFQNYLKLLGPLQNELLTSDLYIHAALHQPSGNTETKVLPHFLPIPSLAGRSQKRSDFRLAYTTFTPQTIKHRPLLILHGYAEYGPVNFELIARQAGSRLVYVIHWPGHGASDGIRDIPFYAETSSDYVEACLEFLKMIQHHHPEGVDVIAHIMGGAILLDTLGTHMGQSYQSLIHHLVLSAPMLALKGMGWLSEVLYSNTFTRKLLALMARNSRKPKSLISP